MFLAASMVCVYLCLLIRTFESEKESEKEAKDQNDGDLKVSKTNSKCIALGKSLFSSSYMYSERRAQHFQNIIHF